MATERGDNEIIVGMPISDESLLPPILAEPLTSRGAPPFSEVTIGLPSSPPPPQCANAVLHQHPMDVVVVDFLQSTFVASGRRERKKKEEEVGATTAWRQDVAGGMREEEGRR